MTGERQMAVAVSFGITLNGPESQDIADLADWTVAIAGIKQYVWKIALGRIS